MKSKRKLTESEAQLAYEMLEQKKHISDIAKHFKVNKPSVKKALDLWNSEDKTHSDGTRYRFRRGNMEILEIPKQKTTEEVLQENV